ncbi:abortive infection system antitoxin AbiGi family protein [Nocardiopsis suaedae]|uniref:abortive infection system antitoxin AbiGi family protein n=1 Tax=Nocardiopsis suaedae TaxID=3018444 RepID=UPI0022E6F314|nr:abortive infection system antitoxin AbiGi family protein [Nocardiopsis suaedae]
MGLKGYGLAITKSYARSRGVNPVWYLDQTPLASAGTWLTKSVKALVEEAEAKALEASAESGSDYFEHLAKSEILRLTPFIEAMGTYNVRREFWWEREWRHVGDFEFLAPSDIVVAFVPERDHGEFRAVLTGYVEHLLEEEDPFVTGSGAEPLDTDYYTNLVLVDVTWSLEHMIATIAGARAG